MYIPTQLPSHTKHMRSLLHKRFAANRFTNVPHRRGIIWKGKTSVDRLQCSSRKSWSHSWYSMLQLASLHSPISCPIAGIELDGIEAEPEN